jgi:hypothetical protein
MTKGFRDRVDRSLDIHNEGVARKVAECRPRSFLLVGRRFRFPRPRPTGYDVGVPGLIIDTPAFVAMLVDGHQIPLRETRPSRPPAAWQKVVRANS